MRFVFAVFCALLPVTLSAGVITFDPYSSPGVDNAINSDGFFAGGRDLFGTNAWASGPQLWASGTSYSDAGIVLFFNGGLTLGQLEGVSVDSTGSPLAVNLWLDTGGDGKFFSFGGLSGTAFSGLNGDTYAGGGPPSINKATSFYMLGGNGAGSTYTLGDLQSGLLSGVDGATPTALWLGVVHGGGVQDDSAYVSSITVTTSGSADAPEPSSLALMSAGLIGCAVMVRRRRAARSRP
jgi:hypothetical protein